MYAGVEIFLQPVQGFGACRAYHAVYLCLRKKTPGGNKGSLRGEDESFLFPFMYYICGVPSGTGEQ